MAAAIEAIEGFKPAYTSNTVIQLPTTAGEATVAWDFHNKYHTGAELNEAKNVLTITPTGYSIVSLNATLTVGEYSTKLYFSFVLEQLSDEEIVDRVLEDIERILNFLDGNMTENVDSFGALECFFKTGETKNIPMKYFKATFYKKGTVHLTFTCPELIERFNIYAAQRKAWLPPCYGKKAYKNMTAEEKAVIDGFQGEEAYNEVISKANYYLAPVTNNQMLMLDSGEEG
jgi:hypothetical protein